METSALNNIQEKRDAMLKAFNDQHKTPAKAEDVKGLFDALREQKCLTDAGNEISDLAAAILNRGLQNGC